MQKILKIPLEVHDKFKDIIEILKSCSTELLNNEYYELSLELATKLARKRPSLLLSGRPNTWAAGIIHTLGMVNFCLINHKLHMFNQGT